MDSSQPSEASRARRDAILDDIRNMTQYSVAGVKRQLEEEVPPMILAQAEADDWVRLPVDILHYRVDGLVWISYFPDRYDEFQRRFPEPPSDRPSCPEYEPYRARVKKKRLEETVDHPIQDIPTDLWQTQGFLGMADLGILGMADLGITEWCITLPATVTSADTLITGVVNGAASPWVRSPFIVHVKPGIRVSLTLRWRVPNDAPRFHRAAHEAWLDLVGWYYDLMAGNHFALDSWVAKAAQTRGRAMSRDASSLRRLVEAKAYAHFKYDAAVDTFNLQGILPADRETSVYKVSVIGDRLETWWVKDLLCSTGLDEARHRHIGWWAWYTEVSRRDGRHPSPAEAREILQLYQTRGIAVPIVESAVRNLLELTSGPFGGIDRTLQVIEAWVRANPERLLLPSTKLGCLALSTLNRMLPRAHAVEAYYLKALFPAAVTSFLDSLDGTPDAIRLALVSWLEENPEGHLGPIGERARVLFDLWHSR
ncbi:hypothetical protein C8A00DRAFT_35239 [Chaetomidium leptoderma]|uniref:Uncharacterized protein n=1 Tax=Chaetomidium leptoderma TaxID=669021 RepID=A0AAN6VJR1_9PEZI|nr:hypothetical protein C8A00DRAFT_35239 [Chaetomidium leptoderma]